MKEKWKISLESVFGRKTRKNRRKLREEKFLFPALILESNLSWYSVFYDISIYVQVLFYSDDLFL